MRLSVGSPGMFTTVQDLGRYGCRSRGVPVAGAMDGPALRLGNTISLTNLRSNIHIA